MKNKLDVMKQQANAQAKMNIELELANKTSDIMRYDAIMEPHHHIFDKVSGWLMDYEDNDLLRLIEKHLSKKDIPFFNIHDIQIRINGEMVERQQKLEF